MIKHHKGDLAAAQTDKRLGPALGPKGDYPNIMSLDNLNSSAACRGQCQVGDWRCRQCGLHNSKNEGKCERCKNPKQIATQNVRPQSEPHADNGKWIDEHGYGAIIQHTIVRMQPGSTISDPNPL